MKNSIIIGVIILVFETFASHLSLSQGLKGDYEDRQDEKTGWYYIIEKASQKRVSNYYTNPLRFLDADYMIANAPEQKYEQWTVHNNGVANRESADYASFYYLIHFSGKIITEMRSNMEFVPPDSVSAWYIDDPTTGTIKYRIDPVNGLQKVYHQICFHNKKTLELIACEELTYPFDAKKRKKEYYRNNR